MKKIVWFLLVSSTSVVCFADRLITFECSNDEYDITFTQVLNRATVTRTALIIRDGDYRDHTWNDLAGTQDELDITTDGDSTIITSRKSDTILSKFTVSNVIGSLENYSATLILIDGDEERLIEFESCQVNNSPTKSVPPPRNLEVNHTRIMK